VYVATPHAQHAPAAAAALRAGRAVLCEKPLTPTAADTAALIALSASRGVFLMEALWTRLLPLYDQIGARIRAGAIGEIRHVQASFGFAVAEDPASRLFDPAQAGGALLDIGIYPLAMMRWALQAERRACPEPVDWQLHGERATTGVDRRVHGHLRWADGVQADFRCGFDGPDDNALHLVGTRGRIDVPHEFWQATHAVWTDAAGRTEALHAPFAVNGFEYQVAEVARAVRAGQIESPRMPHAESLALARWLDHCRAAVGVRYPFEP
jgi:predicted dehydrogenase